MGDTGDVKLEYALRDDSLLHVSHFDHMRGHEKGRPTDLSCPQCKATVFPVLGYEVTDHYRHQSETNCGLSGESALHFNAKVSLAQEMNKYRKASLVYRCRVCSSWYPFLHIGPYDRVEPEIKVSVRRPDVSCLRGSAVVGMAEIFHSHAVDFKKKNDLNALGHPWFEIPAINVHRQYFKHIEADGVFSIDATGAGITYPATPKVCEVCAPEEARRAENWRRLYGQAVPTSPTTSAFDEWQKMVGRRKAETLQKWNEFKASPHSDPSDVGHGRTLEAIGIVPEVDQWGIKPSTPGLEPAEYIALVSKRRERWLDRNRKSRGVEED